MSDSEKDPLQSLLSSFALGPAWARDAGGGQKESRAPRPEAARGERPPRRDERGDERRDRDREDGRRPFKGRGRSDDRRSGPPQRQEAPPADGVRVTLVPDADAVHLIGKEIHQVARVYPLYDVAKILLAERGRCRAVFEAPEPHAPLWRGKLDDSLFLTRAEAVRHLWHGELRERFIEEETIEVDPPTGNFQLVAKCGLSGEWLGPPNFHAYQVTLRRLHRERFPNMPFAAYSAKVRTERGEEAVNAWLETMTKKTRWRVKGDPDDAWIEDRAEAERALAARCFDEAFEETRRAEMLASVPAANLSPSLMVSLKMAGNHARNHPAILIPAVCKAVEAEHLPVFKRQGKLYTGPARPHPLPPGASLAERPAIMVEWIRANKPAKLEGLWKAVLPEGGTAPPAEFAADLFWLLTQGHILLFTDDTLVVQEVRDTPPAEPGSGKKKKKKSQKTPPAATNDSPSPAEDSHCSADDSQSPADDSQSLADDSQSLADDSQSLADDSQSLADDSQSPADEPPTPAAEAPEPAAPEVPELEITGENEFSKNPPAEVDEPPAL